MHSAIQESQKVSATEASTAIVASRRMVLDTPACHGWQPLRPKLLSSPYGGTNLFGGSFYTHIDSATRTQEQLTQVRRLTAPRAPTTRPGPSGPPRAGGQPQRWTPPPPAPTSVRGGAAGGPPASKRRRTKSSRCSGQTTVARKHHGVWSLSQGASTQTPIRVCPRHLLCLFHKSVQRRWTGLPFTTYPGYCGTSARVWLRLAAFLSAVGCLTFFRYGNSDHFRSLGPQSDLTGLLSSLPG